MSRGNGYWSGLERPIAWCATPGCGARGVRTGKDGRRLCPKCRAILRPRHHRANEGPEQAERAYRAALAAAEALAAALAAAEAADVAYAAAARLRTPANHAARWGAAFVSHRPLDAGGMVVASGSAQGVDVRVLGQLDSTNLGRLGRCLCALSEGGSLATWAQAERRREGGDAGSVGGARVGAGVSRPRRVRA